MADRTEHRLPDGSTAVVEVEGNQVGIERWVAGVCVWGQVFSHSWPHERDRLAADVVGNMRANPAAFNRRLLWDEDGRAVAVSDLDNDEALRALNLGSQFTPLAAGAYEWRKMRISVRPPGKPPETVNVYLCIWSTANGRAARTSSATMP